MLDDWRVGFVRNPMDEVLRRCADALADAVWLPTPARPFQYLADPFPVVEDDGRVTIFVEHYDPRTRHGEIRYHRYHGDRHVEDGLALRASFHLSYPQIIRHAGALFMLPEAYRSGRLTLYRCVRFPDRWEPDAVLMEGPVVDATVAFHEGRWWMFHALAGPDDRDMRELHLSTADDLMGPWTPHPQSPIRQDWMEGRPGGSPFVVDDRLHLPVQECRPQYGAAIRILRFDTLTPERVEAHRVVRITPEGLSPGHEDGLHTLSGDGPITCFDVKAHVRSSAARGIKLEYKIRRLIAKTGSRFGRQVRA